VGSHGARVVERVRRGVSLGCVEVRSICARAGLPGAVLCRALSRLHNPDDGDSGCDSESLFTCGVRLSRRNRLRVLGVVFCLLAGPHGPARESIILHKVWFGQFFLSFQSFIGLQERFEL
jgi:hypothetical protein